MSAVFDIALRGYIVDDNRNAASSDCHAATGSFPSRKLFKYNGFI